MAPFLSVAAAWALALVASASPALAEPVQYCRNGYREGQVDFCVGISTYQNATSQKSDVFFSLSIPRSSALGWTALGTGAAMAGSLMFIVYGDPHAASSAPPVVSIRTIDGHHQPHLIDDKTLPAGASLQILHSAWQPVPKPKDKKLVSRHEDEPDYPRPPSVPATHTAEIALACYGCGGGAPVSVRTHSQPFIWAWNDRQDFGGKFPLDVHLDMHRHHSGSGGFGTFYADMARSVVVTSDPASAKAPEIQTAGSGMDRWGTSDQPIGVEGLFRSMKERPLPRAHGLLMGVAFLVAFPLGVVLMRAAGGNPFKRHWMVQMGATVLMWLGAAVGAVMTGGRPPKSVHQWVGVVIALGLGVQAMLGWRHHMVFLRIRRRTGVSHGHIWIGRAALLAGWFNVLSGLRLSGHGGLTVGLVAGLVVVEVVGVSVWVFRARRRNSAALKGPSQGEAHALMPTTGTDDYFSLEMSDDEFETDGEMDDKKKEKSEPVSQEVKKAA